MELSLWVDPENFNPGDIGQAIHLMPKSGDRRPWIHSQDYWSEKDQLPNEDLDDGCLVFT